MNAAEVVERLASLAREVSPDELSELTVSLTHGALYDAAVSTFGSWDVALGAVLKAALEGRVKGTSPPTSSSPPPSSPPSERPALTRQAHPDAMRAVLAVTENGYVVRVPAEWIEASSAPTAPRDLLRWPADLGRPLAVADLDPRVGVAALSSDGRLFGWDSRLIPNADVGEGVRRLGERYAVDSWVALANRDRLARRALIMTVSARGKIKASESELFPHPLTTDGIVACLLDDGDALVGVLAVGLSDPVLLVSSRGYAIVFEAAEVRPMGLRAAGVKGMELRGDAAVVAALVPDRVTELAVISRKGYAKRMDINEFRPQSRAGLGLVAAKPGRGDGLAAAAGCGPSADLLITTSFGRCLRLPAEAVPVMGRPARGQPVIELDDREVVRHLARLLPMDFATA